MKIRTTSAILWLGVTALAQGQTPTTAPNADVAVEYGNTALSQRFDGPLSRNVLRVELFESTPAGYSDALNGLGNLSVRIGEAGYRLLVREPETTKGLERPLRVDLVRLTAQPNIVTNSKGGTIEQAQQLAEVLRQTLALNAESDAEKRRYMLVASRKQLETLIQRKDMLQGIVSGTQMAERESLVAKIARLTKARQSLADEIQTRKIRLDVLSQHKQRLLSEQQNLRSADAIGIQLKRMVDLRQEKLKEVQTRTDNTMGSRNEVLEARTALAEAQLRLAEREAAASLPGLASSLEQINLEQTKVSIDADELRSKLAAVERELAPFDVQNPTTQSLDDALSLKEPPSFAKANAMMSELDRQIVQMRVRIAGLQIMKIEPMTQDQSVDDGRK